MSAFQQDSVGAWINKNAVAQLDYSVDWAAWLDGATIAVATWSVPAGLTKVTDFENAGVTTVFLSAGGAVGTVHIVEVQITTGESPPRIEKQVFRVVVI